MTSANAVRTVMMAPQRGDLHHCLLEVTSRTNLTSRKIWIT